MCHTNKNQVSSHIHYPNGLHPGNKCHWVTWWDAQVVLVRLVAYSLTLISVPARYQVMNNHLGSICSGLFERPIEFWLFLWFLLLNSRSIVMPWVLAVSYYYKTWAWDLSHWPCNFRLVIPTVRHAGTNESKQQTFQGCSHFSTALSNFSLLLTLVPVSHVFPLPQQFGLDI